MAGNRCGHTASQRHVALAVALTVFLVSAPAHAGRQTLTPSADHTPHAKNDYKPTREAVDALPPAALATPLKSAAAKFRDSIQRLKGSAKASPVPAKTPTADCQSHPGLCQPATCEVLRPDIKNKCRYVRNKDACGADDQYIAYLEMFYCTSGGKLWPLVSAFYIVWLLLLFYAMSVVAEVFLCPAVQYISETLQLPPDIAGVTLLAFASGAPDIFTQIAAIDGGNAVELELAVSSVMGSGLFICCVSLAAVLFVQRIEITDRTAFVRDVAAYMVATAVTLVFLLDSRFGRTEAIVLLLLYVVYLSVCIYTSRGHMPVTPQHRHVLLPTNSPPFGRAAGLELQQRQPPSAGAVVPNANASARVTLNGNASSLGGRSSSGGDAAAKSQIQKSSAEAARKQEANRRISNGLPGRTVARVSDSGHASATSPKMNRNTATPVQRSTASRRLDMQAAEPLPPISSAAEWPDWCSTDDDTWPEEAMQDPESPLTPARPPSALRQGNGTAALTADMRRLAAAAHRSLSEHLHFSGNWAWDCVVVATAPLVLLMHATMPAVNRGHCTKQRCLALAITSPAFLLVTTGGFRLGLPAFAAIWGASAAGLYALMHTVFLKKGSDQGEQPYPKANSVFAVIAFVQSAVWLATIADEVVALLGAVGAILAIEEDLLGATVLAWGETLPDLFAMLAVARAGQGTMAIAACFGGPVLNLLVGTGAPVLGASLKTGSLAFRLSNGVVALFAETLLLCGALLALLPTVGKWGMSRQTAWLLLVVYGLFQVLFLAVQQHWLFPYLNTGKS